MYRNSKDSPNKSNFVSHESIHEAQSFPPSKDDTFEANTNGVHKELGVSDAEAFAKLKEHRAKRRRKKLIKRIIVIAIILVIVAGSVVAVKIATRQPERVYAPVTDLVRQGSYLNQISASGSLEPSSSSVISPNIEGTISEVNVSAGQTVNKGDVLMTIANKDLDVAVNSAQRNLQDAKTKLNTANRTLNQAKTAENSENMDTGSLKDATRSAQNSVDAAQEAYDSAVAKANERTVVAPETGSVVAMNAQVGESLSDFSNKDGANALIQIADLSQMKVTIQVDEEDIDKIALGQTANITLAAFDDLTLQGSVSGIASVATSNNGNTGNSSGGYVPNYGGQSQAATFTVKILIAEPDARIKPGMTAQVSLITKHYDDVVMVPISALMSDNGKDYYVMLQTDAASNTSERRSVVVVTKNSDAAVIGRSADAPPTDTDADLPLANLKEGDMLMISGGTDQG